MPYVSLGTSQPWDGENWPSPLRLFTPVLCAAIPCERPPHPNPPPHGGRGLLGLRRLEENHRSWHKNTCHQRGHFARSRPTFLYSTPALPAGEGARVYSRSSLCRANAKS